MNCSPTRKTRRTWFCTIEAEARLFAADIIGNLIDCDHSVTSADVRRSVDSRHLPKPIGR